MILGNGTSIVNSPSGDDDSTITPMIEYLGNQQDDDTFTTSLSVQNIDFYDFGSGNFNGGVIYSEGAILLTVTKCTFYNSFGYRGGSIYITGNALGTSISDCHFFNNFAFSGGALYFDANNYYVELKNIIFESSSSNNHGGGMFIGSFNWNFELHNITFHDCHTTTVANSGGGGLYISPSNELFSLVKMKFTGCSSVTLGGGLAIRNNNLDFTLQDHVYSDCSSANGGGAMLTTSNQRFKISSLSFLDCYANIAGGMFFSITNRNFEIQNLIFRDIMAATGASAIYAGFSNSNFKFVNVQVYNSVSSIAQIVMDHSARNILYQDFTFRNIFGRAIQQNRLARMITFDGLEVSHCYTIYSACGLYFQTNVSSVVINNAIFNNVSAEYAGGAIIFSSFASNVRLSNLVGYNTSSKGKGGFLYMEMYMTNITITDLHIENSRSVGSGGGVRIDNFINNLIMANFTIKNSVTKNQGGGYSLGDFSSKMFITNFTLLNCIADSNGGGFVIGRNNSFIEVSHFSLIGNKAFDKMQGGGGIVFDSYNKYAYIHHFEMLDCYSESFGGGMIFFRSNEHVLFQHFVVKRSIAFNADGGAMSFRYDNYNLTVDNFLLEDNLAGYYAGGLAFYSKNRNVTISNFVMRNNSALMGVGGGMHMEMFNNDFYVKNFTFEACKVKQGYGGALSTSSTTSMFITNGKFINCEVHNTVTSRLNGTADKAFGSGGAMYFVRSSKIFVRNVKIHNCYAAQGGGAIFIDSSNEEVQFTDSEITNCDAGLRGGAMLIGNSNTDILLRRVEMHNNSASYGGGLYVTSDNKRVILASTQIENNQAAVSGGGIYLQSSNSQFGIIDEETLSNMIVWETAHPYACNSYDLVIPLTLHDANVNGALIFFDELTSIDKSRAATFKLREVFDDSEGYWPGISGPFIVTAATSLSLKFNSGYCSDVFYGVKMYILPLKANARSISFPSAITRNIAQVEGGAIFVDNNNVNTLLMNTLVAENTAELGSGGGLFCRVANSGFFSFQNLWRNNYALRSGGALMLSLAHFGYRFLRDIFSMNYAQVNGGALTIVTGNGVGVWATDNAVIIDECSFNNNSAKLSGGAVFLESSNTVVLSASNLSGNTALMADGGGIALNSINDLNIRESRFSQNQANKGCGGAISTALNNILTLQNSEIDNNVADIAGGLCLRKQLRTTFRDHSRASNLSSIHKNIAHSLGGGVLLKQSPLWFATKTFASSYLHFTENSAPLGAALFIQGLQDTEIPSNAFSENNSLLHSLYFARNHASVGGTIYWLRDDQMRQPPALAVENSTENFQKIIWEENIAAYGETLATQPIEMIGPRHYAVNNFGSSLRPAIVWTLTDFYAQRIPIANHTFVKAKVDTSVTFNCSSLYPRLLGNDLVGDGVRYQPSIGANFSQLEVLCAPRGNLSVTFETNYGLQDSRVTSATFDYKVTARTEMNLRNCVAGEFISGSLCVQCPRGSYSLVPSSLTCQSCEGVEGVKECASDKIVLQQGYWRMSNVTKAVLQCLLVPESCQGGEHTGVQSCSVGYEGPLCSVCSDGFFLSGLACVPCEPSKSMVTPNILALLIVIGLIICTYAFMHVFFAHTLKEFIQQAKAFYKQMKPKLIGWTNKFKIALATFQIISSADSVLNVKMPANFNSFTRAVNFFNLNISSLIPFNCTQRFNFIQQLVLTTLGPIIATLAILIAFSIEYFYKAHKYAQLRAMDLSLARMSIITKHGETDGEKLIEEREEHSLNEVKNKYLVVWFFLSYLVLPSVTTSIFQLFVCTDIDPENELPDSVTDSLYLSADMTISCHSQYYLNWRYYGIFMVFVYPIGIPLTYYLALKSNKEEIESRPSQADKDQREAEESKREAEEEKLLEEKENDNNNNNECTTAEVRRERGKGESAVKYAVRDDEDVDSIYNLHLSPHVLRLAFLWRAYEPKFWYWELIETFRRILLTAVLSIFSPGTAQQSVFSILLAVFFMNLYNVYAPYDIDADDITAMAGQLQIFFTFFVALILQNDLMARDWENALGIFLIFLNLLVALVTFYYQLKDIYDTEEDLKKFRMKQELKKRAESRQVRRRSGFIGVDLSQLSKIHPIDFDENNNDNNNNNNNNNKNNNNSNYDHDADDDSSESSDNHIAAQNLSIDERDGDIEMQSIAVHSQIS